MAAIYTPLWPPADTIVTTTLYPLEETDILEMSASFAAGRMDPIPIDSVTYTHALISGSYTQLRWFYTDSIEDSVTYTHDLISGSYTQLRWFYTHAEEDSVTYTHDLIDGSYVRKLIFGDSPDEELIFTADVLPGSSMTPV